ncbi:MAG TPA: magnesium-translocating P-type ATPase [Hyphomicrobiaceae bacterium]|nr:magnesium-translocating P-type ATPase [Hyphomicrobiaceae bacterium]
MTSHAESRFWNEPLDALLRGAGASAGGLSQEDAARRLAEYGPNDALTRRRRPLWLSIADRFANPLILILLFASGLAAWTGDVTSFVIIVVIILLSVVLDVAQQWRAENIVDALRRSVGLKALVVRDGHEREIPIELLVPGDVVKLAAGDIVPADCRLLASRDVFVNQSLLTGESYPVEKHSRDVETAADEPGGAVNSAFMGTSVISGTATAFVFRTGRATELGALAGRLASQRPPDAFEHGIRNFGLLMLQFTIFLVLFVLAANVLFHRPWLESLLFALALAVGLTPELLPMVVTVTLAKGARRLAERRVIVKRLAAIHDLGAMDVLCTDKTGTLTAAQIGLVRHVDANGADSPAAFQLAYVNSVFESGIKSPLDQAIIAHGTPDIAGWHKIDEVPFDFERRRVSVLVDDGSTRLLVVKGAPEDVIHLSTDWETVSGSRRPIDDEARAALMRRFEQLGEQGYRVLAVASRAMDRARESAAIDDETGLTFAGFLAFLDPPKPDAAAAIRALSGAGVNVKILTGDNERITRQICNEIGVQTTGVLTGQELAHLNEDALSARLASVNLFCRVTPQQKERILLALKRTGSVVGFLGDGINDASALRAADVGISVDSAADVAKEAADLVLLDHDLGVVHDGVMEGRRTVENVTKYILMGSSSNLGNMFSMAGAALFLPFLPMLPTQVLLNNLLYDCSEVGVPFDNVDAEAIRRPVHWDMAFIRRFMLVLGPVSSIFDFLTFWALLTLFGADEATFQTGWFIESLATQSLVIFVIRTRRRPWLSRPHPLLAALSIGVVVIGLLIPLTPLATPFRFVEPPSAFYVFLIVAVAGYLVLVETIKQTYYRRVSGARHSP